ncbi:MAG: hypothetical protein RLZZ444_3268 [Pseudomonadota bacterium]|jgi:hypothetical protein
MQTHPKMPPRNAEPDQGGKLGRGHDGQGKNALRRGRLGLPHTTAGGSTRLEGLRRPRPDRGEWIKRLSFGSLLARSSHAGPDFVAGRRSWLSPLPELKNELRVTRK